MTLARVAVDGIGCGAATIALVVGHDLEVMADHARLGVACRLRRGQRCAVDDAPASALAIRERRRVVLPDLAGTTVLSARQTGLYRGLGHTALLAAPLVVQGQTIGALELVDTGGPRAFTSADVAFAEFVASQASLLVAEECGTGPLGPAVGVTSSGSGGASPPADTPPSLSTGSPASRPTPAGSLPPGSSGAEPPDTALADLVADLQRRNQDLARIVAAGLHDIAGLRPDEVLRSLLRRASELTHTPVVDVYVVEGPVVRALASFDGGRFDADWEGVVLPLARYPCSLRAVDTQEATIVAGLEDAGLSDEDRYSLEKWGYQAQLSLPLVAEGRVIGLMELSDYAARDFTPELEMVRGLGAAVTQALQNFILLEQLERRNRILRELVGIGSSASAEHDPSRALAHVAERILTTLSAASCDIYALEEDGFRCLVSHDRSGPDEAPRGSLLDVESYPTLAAEIAAHRTFAITSPDDPRLGAHERRLYREHGFVSEIAVPLVADGRLFGLIDVYDTRERDYGEYLGFLQTIAGGLAGRMEVQAILQGLEDRGRTLAALVELTAAAAQAGTPRELAVTVATRLRETAAMARCDVYSLDGGLLHCLASVDEHGLDHDPDFEFAIDDFPTTAMSVHTGEPLAIERLDADPRLTPEERAHYAEGGFRSELCLPLTADGRVLGLIDLFDRRSRELGWLAELAGPIAPFVAGLLDTLVRLKRASDANLTADDATRYAGAPAAAVTRGDTQEAHDREMEVLDEIAAAASAGSELSEIAAAGLAGLRTLLAFERAAVAVCQGDGSFAWVHAIGVDGAPAGLLEGPDLLDILPDVLRRERVVVLDARSVAEATRGRHQAVPASTAVAALLADGELVGALRVESTAECAFTAADRRLLSRVSAQLALAITSAELYGRVRQVHHSNLRALSGALNAKDYYTLGHAARVAAYMVLLGRELGWGREALRYVEEAAYLHDIGKIAVSDRVLLKAGGLNHREWDLMRQHPIFSAQIIQPLFDHELVAGVRHHHERWDGQGYPDGLAGNAIPLLARAMCVVDSYDAMSLRRPYRQARAYEECLSELRQCAGTHFDPELVSAFLRVLERLRTTKRTASEVAHLAAARVDPAVHARLGTLEDETTPSYEAIVGALRQVRDAHPPTRFLTTLARHGRRAVVVVDAEDEGSPQRSHIGDEVPFDDDLDAVFSGRAVDSNTLYVDQFGVWVSAVEAIRDRGGATIAVAAADLPIEGDGEMDTLRSEVSEAFAAMLELGTGQSMRSELEAVVDSLTGLYTHRYFHERLNEELERCRSHRTSLAVLLLDLDDFRAFNECHGHSAGDGALRAVAHVVESSVRRIDAAARYGGEEFAALLIDTDEPGAVEVAERIREGIAALSLAGGGENLSVSIGVATYPVDASFKDELLDKADWAMHLAKRQGRDAAVAFNAEHGPGQAGPAAGVDPLYVAALSDLAAAGDAHRRRRRAAVAQIALAVARELGLDPADVRACMSSATDDRGGGGPSGAGPGATARLLVSVAAGFTAMVAAPPYRPGASEAEALARLLRCPALRDERRLAEAFADVVGRRRAP